MIQGLKLTKVSMAIIVLSSPLYAQENFQSINLAGTVIAENESGLSYEAQGCITEVSQEAVNSGLAIKETFQKPTPFYLRLAKFLVNRST